jgi:hypothetical protein
MIDVIEGQGRHGGKVGASAGSIQDGSHFLAGQLVAEGLVEQQFQATATTLVRSPGFVVRKNRGRRQTYCQALTIR